MKIKHLLVPVLALSLVGCANSNKLNAQGLKDLNVAPAISSVDELLEQVNFNYTRETQMHFNETAYAKVKQYNKFPFTQHRTTYWIEDGLYMTEQGTGYVNSGYFSRKENNVDTLYHYRLPDKGYEHITDTVVPEGFEYAKAGVEKSVHDFFPDIANLKKDGLTATFTYDEVDGSYVSTDTKVLDLFLGFTASCYTNPVVKEEAQDPSTNEPQAAFYLGRTRTFDKLEASSEEGTTPDVPETPFLTFKEARIHANSNNTEFYFDLYVTDDCKDKLGEGEQTTGLFSQAIVRDMNTTEIPVLTAFLNK